MTLSSHLVELRKKHDMLSTLVEKEQRSPAKNDLQIVEWKRQKLKLKEEISRLSETH